MIDLSDCPAIIPPIKGVIRSDILWKLSLIRRQRRWNLQDPKYPIWVQKLDLGTIYQDPYHCVFLQRKLRTVGLKTELHKAFIYWVPAYTDRYDEYIYKVKAGSVNLPRYSRFSEEYISENNTYDEDYRY